MTQPRHPLELERDGAEVIESVLAEKETSHLARILENWLVPGQAGSRNLLTIPEVRALSHHGLVRAIVDEKLGRESICVRAIYFDKSTATNWHLPLHQDRAIAVNGRTDNSGWSGWSIKEGIPHVLPPVEYLERMMAIRIHLDACDESNGALFVVRGSHRLGIVDPADFFDDEKVLCPCRIGDALLMKPLVLHGSAKSQTSASRRVIHLEYAHAELPIGLNWFFN